MLKLNGFPNKKLWLILMHAYFREFECVGCIQPLIDASDLFREWKVDFDRFDVHFWLRTFAFDLRESLN